jgi:dTDP-glucose 4,6-dehydratase
MKPKSLLIIGGTGFFGKSILKYFSNSKYLKKKFYKITILSRSKFNKFDYLNKLKKNFKIIKINSDILKVKKLPYADYIIYAAILKNFKDDYLAVKNYIKLAPIYHRNSKILYTSTGAVYGKQPKKIQGFKENYFKFNKRINFKKGYKRSYSSFKLKSEKLFQKLGQINLNVSIARCFSFVGEFLPLNSGYVIGNFINNILNREPIKIKSNCNVIRSYMYEDDLVKWLLKILLKANNNCPIYNVGSDHKVNIKKIGLYLAKKNKLNLEFKSVKKSFNDIYFPSINKAKKELNLKICYNSYRSATKTLRQLHNKSR